MKEVKIVYCVPCGYLPRAEDLKKIIRNRIKDVDVKLEGGTSGVMDIFVDNRLIFSKWKEGRFPESNEILKKLEGS